VNNMNLVTFGDIIEIKYEHYVLLALKNGIYYLAKIQDKDISQRFISLRKRKEGLAEMGDRNASKNLEAAIFCFVRLTTEEYLEQVASCLHKDGQLEEDKIPRFNKMGTLNKQDIEEMRKEILLNKHQFPSVLITEIEQL